MSNAIRVRSEGKNDIANGHWLAGLTDGEGCFFLSTTRKREDRASGVLYRCMTFEFRLLLRADDIETLRQAHRLLGVGKVNIYRRGSSPKTSANAKPVAVLSVYRRDDVPRVIEVFRRFPLRSKKARDFLLWTQAFETFARALRSAAPVRGARRVRFKTIPDDVWSAMAAFEKQIEATREYRAPQ